MTQNILTPIWFDIDGTLLHTRVGHGAFQRALLEIYGWEDSMETVRFAGNTDLQVLLDLSQYHGGHPDASLPNRSRFFERMAHYLDQGLEIDKPQLIPGVVDLLSELCQMPQILLGLLTGNARECAFIKLRHAQLHHHFQDGGFGDEHHDRNTLATLARAKANQALPHGTTLAAGWVIGDTPRDIQAARQMGARCLAVASGAYTADVLLQAGADHISTDLHPTPELIKLLGKA